MKKRLISAIALALTLLLAVSACATSGQPGDAASSAATSAATTAAPAKTTAPATTAAPAKTAATTAASTAPAAEAPAEFTMFYQEAGQNFPDGFKHDDNWFVNHICEMANVKITELIVPAYADTATKFNLMMSSGNIPDLVERLSVAEMKQHGMEGAFMPTEDIIRGSAVMSKIYDDVQIRYMQSSDGVPYVIINPPMVQDFDSIWVRQDLLEEVGYTEIPDTLDGLTEAARALKEKYPDSLPFEGPGLVWRSSWMIRSTPMP
jgi:ABC-type glycerol-3-phosphate transport system substrate-binding protein